MTRDGGDITLATMTAAAYVSIAPPQIKISLPLICHCPIKPLVRVLMCWQRRGERAGVTTAVGKLAAGD